MKDFAGDNFKFDENGRKLSKPVENTVGQGEIARYEQFLLFPQCFQKACILGASKGVIVWEWVNCIVVIKGNCLMEVNALSPAMLSFYPKRTICQVLAKQKYLDCSKRYAEDTLILVKMVKFIFDRVENIVGKGENAGYQHFLLFPQCF